MLDIIVKTEYLPDDWLDLMMIYSRLYPRRRLRSAFGFISHVRVAVYRYLTFNRLQSLFKFDSFPFGTWDRNAPYLFLSIFIFQFIKSKVLLSSINWSFTSLYLLASFLANEWILPLHFGEATLVSLTPVTFYLQLMHLR